MFPLDEGVGDLFVSTGLQCVQVEELAWKFYDGCLGKLAMV